MKQTAKILKTIEGVLVKKFQTIIDNKSIEKDKEKIKIELRSLVLKLITEKIERRPLIFIDIV